MMNNWNDILQSIMSDLCSHYINIDAEDVITFGLNLLAERIDEVVEAYKENLKIFY